MMKIIDNDIQNILAAMAKVMKKKAAMDITTIVEWIYLNHLHN